MAACPVVGRSYGEICTGNGYQLYAIQPWALSEYFPEEGRHKGNVVHKLTFKPFNPTKIEFLQNFI
jgi:hypothetical protein